MATTTVLSNAHYRKRPWLRAVEPESLLTPLDIPERTVGGYSIRHIKQPKGWSAALSSFRIAFFQGDAITKVAFPMATRWHELSQADQGVWTTDLPIERVQQERDVMGFKGVVLCTGLGVGLTPVLLAARSEIAVVVVVERSAEVIELVKPHLPRDLRRKIQVVCDDAFEYLATTTDRFDYVFHDIWQSDGLGTLRFTIAPLKKLTRRVLTRRALDGTRVRCWNEGVMLGQLYLQIVERLRGAADGYPPELRQWMEPPPVKLLDDPNLCLSANYWRWWYQAKPAREVAARFARDYCSRKFGSSEWEKRWGPLQHCDREGDEDAAV